MMKSTLNLLPLIALVLGPLQTQAADFDGLTVSGALVGQSVDYDGDIYYNDDIIQSKGFGLQFDHSVNKILGITGGFTQTTSNDLDDLNIDLKTQRFYSGLNLGYRFEGEHWAIKPFAALGFNVIKRKASGPLFSETDSVNKPYLGAGAALSYQNITATVEADASKLAHGVMFVESRFTLGYRF